MEYVKNVYLGCVHKVYNIHLHNVQYVEDSYNNMCQII